MLTATVSRVNPRYLGCCCDDPDGRKLRPGGLGPPISIRRGQAQPWLYALPARGVRTVGARTHV